MATEAWKHEATQMWSPSPTAEAWHLHGNESRYMVFLHYWLPSMPCSRVYCVQSPKPLGLCPAAGPVPCKGFWPVGSQLCAPLGCYLTALGISVEDAQAFTGIAASAAFSLSFSSGAYFVSGGARAPQSLKHAILGPRGSPARKGPPLPQLQLDRTEHDQRRDHRCVAAGPAMRLWSEELAAVKRTGCEGLIACPGMVPALRVFSWQGGVELGYGGVAVGVQCNPHAAVMTQSTSTGFPRQVCLLPLAHCVLRAVLELAGLLARSP